MISFLDDGDLVEQDRDWINRILGFSADSNSHRKGSSSVEFPFENVPRFLPSAAEDAACSPTGLDSQPPSAVEPNRTVEKNRRGAEKSNEFVSTQPPNFVQPPAVPPPSVNQTAGPPPPFHQRRTGNHGSGLLKTPPGPPRAPPLHLAQQPAYPMGGYLTTFPAGPVPANLSQVYHHHPTRAPLPAGPMGPPQQQVIFFPQLPGTRPTFYGQMHMQPVPQRPPPPSRGRFHQPIHSPRGGNHHHPHHPFSPPGPSPPRYRSPSQHGGHPPPPHSSSRPPPPRQILEKPPPGPTRQPISNQVPKEKTAPTPQPPEEEETPPAQQHNSPELTKQSDAPISESAREESPKAPTLPVAIPEKEPEIVSEPPKEEAPESTAQNEEISNKEVIQKPEEAIVASGPDTEDAQDVTQKEASPEPQPGPPAPKSWASLFSGSKNTGAIVYASPDSPPSPPRESSKASKKTVPRSEDPGAKELCDVLKGTKLIHRGQGYGLRGLKNSRNDCYANAVLQSLLACPPFFNLLKDLIPFASRQPTSTPLVDAMASFCSEFTTQRDRQSRYATGPFTPHGVHEAVKALNPSDAAFKQGLQEDAEEFLLTLLNGLHEELLNCTKQNSERVEEDGNDEWQEVGPGKRAAVTRRVNTEQTLISEIFCGKHRNVVKKGSARETVNLEPFFTLPLEIQKDEIVDINSAIISSLGQETIKQITSDSREVETTKLVKLQDLPPVLIIQLKRFVYTAEGTGKVMKKVRFDEDLHIPKEIIHPSAHWSPSRSYKLFAVVFHHGKEAKGGHYTANVFHARQWMELDDAVLRRMELGEVLKEGPGTRVPYLLFYRRCDLLHHTNAHYQ